MMPILKLGTRKSLLAVAHSSWVAREVERLNPGVRVELVGIETRGDVILDKPLSQIEGKEFFTAELDHALLDGSVDFTVHSMKDLSIDRPPSIRLAAVPERELAHDVILFHETVTDRIRSGLPVRIGTSSPRRLTLIPEFLKSALPRIRSESEPGLQFIEIRGNVNTRLSRVHEPEGHERKLDGVVLAFAGLERLAKDPTASIELRRLLQNTRMMVLPLKTCPSAPAQGALAIETRADRPEVIACIERLHHPGTLEAVRAEREILEEWGGGCHQKLGASRMASGALFIKGVKPDGTRVEETRGLPRPQEIDFTRIEAGDVFDFEKVATGPRETTLLESQAPVFIAHTRAFDHLDSTTALRGVGTRIWVSGTQSWFKLARQGLWIEGSLDGQGFESMGPFMRKALLGFEGKPFTFLSHTQSPPASGTELLATYTHRFREVPGKFIENDRIYWSSGLPFQELWSKVGAEVFKGKTHACGPGRTAQLIKEKLAEIGMEPVILSVE
jgi:hydroxymethylbilane synthase